VGVAEKNDDGVNFSKRLTELNEEFEILDNKASKLEEKISHNSSFAHAKYMIL